MKTHKVIEIIKSRDSDEVTKVLKKFSNLKLISRDRRASYRSIEGNYIHIAGRFHLIMNLSDKITSEIKMLLPTRIQIIPDNIEDNSSIKFHLENKFDSLNLSNSSIKKIALIKQVRSYYEQGYSKMHISRELKLDKKTVKKYLSSKDIVETAQYSPRKQTCYLEQHEKLIMELYKEKRHTTKVLDSLSKVNIHAKRFTLHNFIKKRISENHSQGNPVKYINRRDIINYIFAWSYRPMLLDHIDYIFQKYKVLKKYKQFYEYFKTCLIGLRKDDFKGIIEKAHDCNMIDSFIANLKQDYEAVLNAATYKLNNGLLEGQVNKLKKIKRDMYGRASIYLLRKKVIYQSLLSC